MSRVRDKVQVEAYIHEQSSTTHVVAGYLYKATASQLDRVCVSKYTS